MSRHGQLLAPGSSGEIERGQRLGSSDSSVACAQRLTYFHSLRHRKAPSIVPLWTPNFKHGGALGSELRELY